MSVMNLNQRIGLSFDGECETAFKFYERCLNGKIVFLRRWGEPRWSESGVRVFLNRATNASARAFVLCLAIAFGLSCAFRDKSNNTKAAMDAIRQQIAKYTAALDAADIDLASQVWRTSAEVSFIHPAGHAHGWEEVKGIYKFFGSFFSERKLTVRDVSIHVNGETAWAEFYWHFAAKQSKDGSAVQTDGRETQIYEKAGNRWQLVHVHYSGRAIAP